MFGIDNDLHRRDAAGQHRRNAFERRRGVACGSLATLLLRLANWLVRRGAVRLAAVGNGEPEREFHVANGYGGQGLLAQHSRLAILLGERFGEEVSLVLR